MKNTIKIPVMFMTLALLVLLPNASFAWGGDHGRDEGRTHHGGGGYRSHENPDLVLVSGMDTIDRRVLVAGDPDPVPDEIDQPAAVIVETPPAQTVGQDMDTFIVNVPNSQGGYTPVLIKKWGNGYVGPQGELYFPFPQVSQLKAMYGM